MNEIPEDPVEKMVALTLTKRGIKYVHNVIAPTSNVRTLDFHLPEYGLYIECKRFSTDRLHDQIKGLTNVIVIQGIEAAASFDQLLNNMYYLGHSAAN